jgi:hypothetical protein
MDHYQMADVAVNGHRWPQPSPRRVEVGCDGHVLQRHCTRCGRDFIVTSSGSVKAVAIAPFSFFLLDDEVTERWLTEQCPRVRLPGDDGDRKRRVAELRLSG